MNHLVNITRKELKELLTPGSVLSIVIVVVLMMAIGTMVSAQTDDAKNPSAIGILNGDVDGDSGTYDQYSIECIYHYYETIYDLTQEEAEQYIIMMESEYGDDNAIISEMQSKGLTSALIIEPDYSENISNHIQATIYEYYIFENQGMMSSVTSSIADLLIAYVSNSISTNLLTELTGDSDYAIFLENPVVNTNCDSSSSISYTYINGKLHSGVTPFEISTSMMSQNLMIPIVIMIVIVMIGSIVISSMGNEKENKTLETLLTLPVKRTTIVGGKLLASAIAGLIFGLAYLVGMMFYMSGLTSSVGGKDLSEYGLSLNVGDWIVIMVMIFLAIFCALGICMILGAFVKNYKAAQTMTLPISVLAMIPMFVMMFSSWESLPTVLQVAIFAIPFSHPMMVMDNLMFGNYTIVIGGLIYLVIFTIITIALTVKIYKSDILLTGLSQTKFAKMFSKKKKSG